MEKKLLEGESVSNMRASPGSLNVTACEFCGCKNFASYLKTDLVSYSKCLDCGLVFQNPVITQEQITDMYDSNYFEYEVSNQENFYRLMRLGLRDINFDSIKGTLPSKRVLDIGCATGFLLAYFKSEGFETVGVEICSASAAYAREHHNLEIISKPLLDAKFESNHFGLIHFSHLIEHVPNPAAFLREVYRILAPGGYIVVTTPNADGFFSKHYKTTWRAVMPQHLWLFSFRTLSGFLNKIGFKVVKRVSWGGIPIEKNPHKVIKYLSDRLIKFFNKGDVVLILCRKD